MLIIKVLIYTGVRVSELVSIKISDIDLLNCQIRINQGKGNKDPVVPFPEGFKEVAGIHCNNNLKNNATYLFESSWKKKYTDRGIRKILEKYSAQAGYNTANQEKKNEYNINVLSKVAGGGLGVLTGIKALIVIYNAELPSSISWLSSWGILGTITLMLILGNTICKN